MRAIVSVCKDWGIGFRGKLLVQNPEDMRWFVQHTTGKTVIMGRSTLESFPGKKPLPHRRNIVLSTRQSLDIPGVKQVRSIGELLNVLADSDPDDLWVIGGQQVYQQLLAYCSEVLVTKHDCVRPADAYFPNLDDDEEWMVASCQDGGVTAEGIAFSFVRYVRR